MYIDKKIKSTFFIEYGNGEKDTGSVEAGIAILTFRIKHLTKHLKENKKDFNTQRSLKQMVGRRRKLLIYLYNNSLDRYRKIVEKLQLSDIYKLN